MDSKVHRECPRPNSLRDDRAWLEPGFVIWDTNKNWGVKEHEPSLVCLLSLLSLLRLPHLPSLP